MCRSGLWRVSAAARATHGQQDPVMDGRGGGGWARPASFLIWPARNVGTWHRNLQQLARQEANLADPVHQAAAHTVQGTATAQPRPGTPPTPHAVPSAALLQIRGTACRATPQGSGSSLHECPEPRPCRHRACRGPTPPDRARTPPRTTCSRSGRVTTAPHEAPRRHRPGNLRKLRRSAY